MSHTVSYKDMPEVDAFTQAISDAKDYIGHERFDHVCKELKKFINDRPYAKEHFLLACSFVGVKGFPAHCLYKYLGGDQ